MRHRTGRLWQRLGRLHQDGKRFQEISDDQGGAGSHRDDIDNQEEVGNASWDCRHVQHAAIVHSRMLPLLTVPVIVQVEQLIAPLCYYSQCVLEESDDDQEAADGWEVSVGTQHMPTTFSLR